MSADATVVPAVACEHRVELPEGDTGNLSLTSVLRDLAKALRRQAGVLPELLNARQAAALCGISLASWHRLAAGGKTPASVRLSGAVRWRRAELLAWVQAGCPDRKAWEHLRPR